MLPGNGPIDKVLMPHLTDDEIKFAVSWKMLGDRELSGAEYSLIWAEYDRRFASFRTVSTLTAPLIDF